MNGKKTHTNCAPAQRPPRCERAGVCCSMGCSKSGGMGVTRKTPLEMPPGEKIRPNNLAIVESARGESVRSIAIAARELAHHPLMLQDSYYILLCVRYYNIYQGLCVTEEPAISLWQVEASSTVLPGCFVLVSGGDKLRTFQPQQGSPGESRWRADRRVLVHNPRR